MLSAGAEHLLRALVAQGAVAMSVGCGLLFLADVVAGLATRHGRIAPAVTRLGRGCPPPLRRLAELTVTALLALGAARPAAASTTPVRDWLSPTTTTTTTAATTPANAPLRPAPTPTTVTTPRPTTRPTTVTAQTLPSAAATPPPSSRPTPTPAPVTATYVVRAGDCLWRIAARALGPRATNAAVDAAWRAIYAANRASIGNDPNLIHPGLVLALPPLPAAR